MQVYGDIYTYIYFSRPGQYTWMKNWVSEKAKIIIMWFIFDSKFCIFSIITNAMKMFVFAEKQNKKQQACNNIAY